ncbi:hypothetical protein QZH41_014491 [Actinostola sp. cb2023]|nr:hypothetical protein QZH41_014491 [Actinostola sp. cb2023]
MDTNERVIQALHEFENMTDADKVLTQELEDLFVQIAHTGRIQSAVFTYSSLIQVMRDFFESSPSRNNSSSEPTHTAEFDVMRQRLLDCIESFTRCYKRYTCYTCYKRYTRYKRYTCYKCYTRYKRY